MDDPKPEWPLFWIPPRQRRMESWSYSCADESCADESRSETPCEYRFRKYTGARMRIVDLFCGAGGMHLAAEREGCEIVLASEINAICRRVYQRRFNLEPCGDVCQISSLPPHDILCAGFPCQPFSVAGSKRGFDDPGRGNMFLEIMRLIKISKPPCIILENVKGFAQHASGETLQTCTLMLASEGYSAQWTILDSRDFGLAQARQRWFCVCFNDPCAASFFRFPEPTTPDRSATVGDVLDDDPGPGLALTADENFLLDERGRREGTVKHTTLEKWRGGGRFEGVYSSLQPDGRLRFHTQVRASGMSEMQYCCARSKAYTLTKSHPTKLHDQRRRLNVRELCRLQGFPDDFTFGSVTAAQQCLGNAVSVPVAQSVISSAKRALLSASSQFQESFFGDTESGVTGTWADDDGP